MAAWGGKPGGPSSEFCDRGTDDDELVRCEPLRELLRMLLVSWDMLEGTRRRTLRGCLGLTSCDLVGDSLDEEGRAEAGLPDAELELEIQGCGCCPRGGRAG